MKDRHPPITQTQRTQRACATMSAACARLHAMIKSLKPCARVESKRAETFVRSSHCLGTQFVKQRRGQFGRHTGAHADALARQRAKRRRGARSLTRLVAALRLAVASAFAASAFAASAFAVASTSVASAASAAAGRETRPAAVAAACRRTTATADASATLSRACWPPAPRRAPFAP